MLYLNIQGLFIEISFNNEIIKSRLCSDFEYFLCHHYTQGPLLKISADFCPTIPIGLLPKNLKPLFQRLNSITYEQNQIRYNDYYGKVLSIFNSQKNLCHIYGIELDKLYEIVYLFILSRTGKFGDLHGIHRLHAFAIVKNFTGLICMQPMRGGKSTLLTELLLKHNVEIISDDTPLINTKGDLIPFPLRVSLDEIPVGLNMTNDQFYLNKREFYKEKFSISLKAFKKPIAQKCRYYHFVEAHRSTYEQPFIKRKSTFSLFRSLFKHMVIGVGLPIIFEYFWETGREDFFKKSIIFLRRFFLAIRLSLSHKGYDLYLTNDSKKNAEALLKLL